MSDYDQQYQDPGYAPDPSPNPLPPPPPPPLQVEPEWPETTIPEVTVHGSPVPEWPGEIAPDDAGEHVRAWQTRMHERGWNRGPVSGVHDEYWSRVCWKFQAEKGLPVTANVDEETWYAAWEAPITPGPGGSGRSPVPLKVRVEASAEEVDGSTKVTAWVTNDGRPVTADDILAAYLELEPADTPMDPSPYLHIETGQFEIAEWFLPPDGGPYTAVSVVVRSEDDEVARIDAF